VQTIGEKAYCFEGFTLDLRRGCVRRADDELELRPKSFEVLCYLVENAGRLVPKDELIKAVWPRNVVTDESLTRCISEVRSALSDAEQRIIKTVPRRGYRFAMPVSAAPSRIAATVTTAGADPSRAPRLSIVVLPFVNLGGDAAQGYFVDAVTDSLTTDLARIPGLFVIGRNTAFAYKDTRVDARQIGRELAVRYVMEGSVLTGADRIRVNAQLIDAGSGAHLWAERFDKPRANIFDMQDEITTRLARSIGIELVTAEGRRAERERPDNMDTVDLTMRGRAILNRPPSVEDARRARALFEAALRLDDRNAEALVGLAGSHIFEVRTFASTDPAEQVRAAETAIDKALALAPGSAYAHYVRAEVLFLMRAPERAMQECELAIVLDRNLPWAHANAGVMKLMIGRCEETEPHIAEAMRLSPRDPALSSWYRMMGITYVFQGRDDHAIEQLRRSIAMNPQIPLTHFVLAAALALTGRMTEAVEARDAGLVLDANFSVARYCNDRRSDNPVFLQQRERMYEGLRKAGVPEGR
jgi:TolB-like protein